MSHRIFGIGETVLDLIIKDGEPKGLKAGGSVLNALVSLARCRHDVYLISEIGNDKSGEFALNFLQKNGIKTDYIIQFSDGQTPLAMAFLDEKNDASYQFYKKYPPERELLCPTHFSSNDIVLFGSFFSVNPDIREKAYSIVQKAKEEGALILYDPNFRKAHQLDDDLKQAVIRNMQQANVVRASNEDLENIFNISDPSKEIDQLLIFCNKIIVTSNAKGVDIYTKGRTKHFPVPSIKPISTIGAGDNFNAGITHALITNKNNFDWDYLIETGISFSKEVCLSYDNYVSVDFAETLTKV